MQLVVSHCWCLPAITHDRHRRILPRPELVEADELDGACREQGSLGVTQEVHEGVHTLHLVVGNVTHGLLAHGTLQGDKETGEERRINNVS